MTAPTAADAWASALAEWRIPPEILAAAPESPWTFPTDVFERRADSSLAGPLTPSGRRAHAALASPGSVLDVGAGGGAAGFALRDRLTNLTAVDASAEALRGLRSRADRLGLKVVTVEGTWPDVEAAVPVHDVVVCHHVVYNVAQIAPFLRALDRHARRRVVVELTDQHPMANLTPLWREFHGVVRPVRPTAADFANVVSELGIEPSFERWTSVEGPVVDPERRVALVRRRLCMPIEREPDVAKALARLAPIDDLRVTVSWVPTNDR